MIKLLIVDIDGTLTSGAITYTANGDEMKSFCVKDGLALSSWVRLGNELAIITGRNSPIVERRAKELGVKYIFQGVKDKFAMVLGICEELNIGLDSVAAIGDDLNDLKMLQKVGKSFIPADAVSYLHDKVDYHLNSAGGKGAAREAVEILFELNGQTEDFIALWQ